MPCSLGTNATFTVPPPEPPEPPPASPPLWLFCVHAVSAKLAATPSTAAIFNGRAIRMLTPSSSAALGRQPSAPYNVSQENPHGRHAQARPACLHVSMWTATMSATAGRRRHVSGSPSMKDVAAHAGVSLGTVSNVLNRPEV